MANKDEIFFDKIKEDRGWYFVEYHPPSSSLSFATLHLTTPEQTDLAKVASAMEAELAVWLKRYPVTIMVSAHDDSGSLYDLSSVRSSDHLIGFFNADKSAILSYWELLKDEDLPNDDLSPERLKEIYKGINYRTPADIQKSQKEHYKKRRLGSYVIFTWAVIIPAITAIFMYCAPKWIGFIVLMYSLSQALIKWLEMKGKIKKSDREKKKEEEEARVRHHHYHCELNPEGFLRLKIENFDKETRDKVQEEADELRAGKSATNS